MIVTRDWLSEFIDLSSVSNEKLYETFNAIGLEVDGIKKYEIADKVVVGKILSCEKHPDADKLNICQIDVGEEVLQIVCGASNVVDASYVGVAKIGAVLGESFEIKDATLRGVKSAGMVCASSELGLPDLGKGIMKLDASMGELIIGKALKEYALFNDTVIELELTANRGDCLSILGVARDLASALDIPLFDVEMSREKVLDSIEGLSLSVEEEVEADLSYRVATINGLHSTLLIDLRLAMVGVEVKESLEALLSYSTHATGVILKAYGLEEEKNNLLVSQKARGVVDVALNSQKLSTVGMTQILTEIDAFSNEKFLIEASYIEPDSLCEVVFEKQLKTDEKLYYKTSRGSNTNIEIGLSFLSKLTSSMMTFSQGVLSYKFKREPQIITLSSDEISLIVGMEIAQEKIVTILEKLEFKIALLEEDELKITVPPFRHDIQNIQDIAEEVVRIIGINHIDSKPLNFVEKPKQNKTLLKYKTKKVLKNRAVGVGFYENVSYVFSDKKLLEKYHFSVVEKSIDITNPIAEELNTLRSTLLINLLNSAKRNVGYSKKMIPLFEIGSVFNKKREEKEVMGFIFSGECEFDTLKNAGKPKNIDFENFVQKIGSILGNFELKACSVKYGIIHPYQSADIIIDKEVCGFLSKLHPVVQEAFDLPLSFICEVDFDKFLPKHIDVKPISKFQGVYKDLSIVIDKKLTYFDVATVLNNLDLSLLKESYPIDIYEDKTLGDKKSLTIRFFIQSMEKTLQERDIEGVMGTIIDSLNSSFDAEVR